VTDMNRINDSYFIVRTHNKDGSIETQQFPYGDDANRWALDQAKKDGVNGVEVYDARLIGRYDGGVDPRRQDCCQYHRYGGNLDFKCR
jgi:hypothetical protein